MMRHVSCALLALMGAAGIGCGSDGKTSDSATSGAMGDEDGACSYPSDPVNVGYITIKNETDSEIFLLEGAGGAVVEEDGTELPFGVNECLQDCATPFEPLFCTGSGDYVGPALRIIAGGQSTVSWHGTAFKSRTIPASCGDFDTYCDLSGPTPSCGEVPSEIPCLQRVAPADGATIRYKAHTRVTCLDIPETCMCELNSDGSSMMAASTSDEPPAMTAEFTYWADQHEELSVTFTE